MGEQKKSSLSLETLYGNRNVLKKEKLFQRNKGILQNYTNYIFYIKNKTLKRTKKEEISKGNKNVLQNSRNRKNYLKKNIGFCLKQNTGITLIALIISVIILLILAGVSLSALVGENGILNQATNAADRTNIASEEEMLSQIVVSENAEKVQNPDGVSSYHIGRDLLNKTLENGNSWNIVVVNETQETYGTGWTFIEKGTELMDYGESKYSWLVNYNSGEKIRLEEESYTELDYSSSMAVTEGLIFNIDPSILDGVTTEELQNDPSILGENVELKNFDWTEESGLTSTSFNFDGENDHINILYDDQESLNALYNNGLTFEYYGTVEEGAHVDYEGNTLPNITINTRFTRNFCTMGPVWKIDKQN